MPSEKEQKHAGIHRSPALPALRTAGIFFLIIDGSSPGRVMRETTGNYATAPYVIAGLMPGSILLPIIVRPPRREGSGEKPRTFGLTPYLAPPRD